MTNYPASIDTPQTLYIAVDNLTPVSAAIVNNLRSAIVAIEQTLGVKPAGPYGTVAARLANDENIVGNLQIISLAGDLGGTLTDPLVVGIQGRPVSSAAPALADVLAWNGIAWIPSAGGGGGGGSVIFSQDIVGTNTAQTVVGIQDHPVSSATPSVGETFIWNGSAWVPGNNFGNQSLFTTGAVVTGPLLSTSTTTGFVEVTGKIIANAVSTSVVSNPGQGIIYFDSATNEFLASQNGGAYFPLVSNNTTQDFMTTGQITSGPLLATSVTTGLLELTGKFIANAISTSSVSDAGQGIIYFDSTDNQFLVSQNGGSYIPLVSGAGSAGGDLSGTYPNPQVVGFDGVPLNGLLASPQNNEYPTYDSTSGEYQPRLGFQVLNVKERRFAGGAKSNANFQNPANFKWYVDSGFTTEATDDTAAIQAAITYALTFASTDTQAVVMLSGNHYLKAPLQTITDLFEFQVFCTVGSNITIQGDGTANLRLGAGNQTLAGNGYCIFFGQGSNLTNITFKDFTYDGNNKSGNASSQNNMVISLFANSGSNFEVSGLTIQNYGGENAVFLSPAILTGGVVYNNVSVCNNSFLNCGNVETLNDHVEIYVQGQGVVIANNIFRSDGADGYVSRNFGNCIQAQVIDAVISNNSISNRANGIALCSIFGVNCESVVISGNVMDGVPAGVGFVQCVGQTLNDVTITGNAFQMTNSQSGQLVAAVEIQTPNAGLGLTNITITGNVMNFVDDTRFATATDAFGVGLTGCIESLMISGNRITNFPNGAIIINPQDGYNENQSPEGFVSAADLKIWDTTIMGNSIQNCGTANIADPPIEIVCPSAAANGIARLRVTDNSITRSDGGPANTFGILISGDGYDVLVINNSFVNMATPVLIEPALSTLVNIKTGITNVAGTEVVRDSIGNINTSYVTTMNSGWYMSENHAGTGTQILMGLDVNNTVRIAPSADAFVVIGAPATSTNCVDGDLLLAEANSIRFPLGSSSAIRALGFADGYVTISADSEPIMFGLPPGTATGGTGPATLGNGFGLGGNNPTTVAQSGWMKFYDGNGNPFFVPIWR